ncbi:D-glycero-beta-D-manno-heptose-7-phosphate kinase [bacterium SCSIO 12741]|nr:D-glycero-beta-D-manno-heptose-7-phosphate kinase [bacterium SCSIO 12741]
MHSTIVCRFSGSTQRGCCPHEKTLKPFTLTLSNHEINTLFDSFINQKVLIIGDVMIDAYYRGKIERISPEAPVPVVEVTSRETRLGGAGNVTVNLAAMKATPIICSVIGADPNGSDLIGLLENEGIPSRGILQSKSRKTTVKTRIISGSQHMLRIDEERIEPLSDEDRLNFIDHILSILKKEEVGVVIFEDYDKGVIDRTVIEKVVEYCNANQIPTAVDPKRKNFLHYEKVTLFKPNLKELKDGLNLLDFQTDVDGLNEANQQLTKKLNHETSLITLSEKGVYISSKGESSIIPAHLRNIADVSGAGDTVISVAALCLAAGTSPQNLAEIANLAGGLVCEQVGVVPILHEDLLKECLSLNQEDSYTA